MIRSANVINTIKSELKRYSITYKKLAVDLGLSESAVKQMFASGNCSLKRLDRICEILGMDLENLTDLAIRNEQRIDQLERAQEKQLISDIELLLVAYCLVNHLTVEDILEKYDLSETKVIRLLAKLDRMKLIELLPGNRVKLLIANNFNWLKNGPIEKFFRTQVQSEFFKHSFYAEGAMRIMKNGDITPARQRQLIERIQSVGKLFDEIIQEERKEPVSERQGTTMILAIRNWNFTVFSKFEKNHSAGVS